MIVIGVDPHKATHTACAVDARTGELVAELTVSADHEGHDRLLCWARGHGRVLLFALEDCRHGSANLERLLLARGEEVVRVPPHIAAGVRGRGRQRGKSDTVDAMAVARASLQEPDLPRARLAGIEREVRLLVDHREDLVAERRRIKQRLRWHLHKLECEIPPSRALGRAKWLDYLAGCLARRRGTQARVCRTLVAGLQTLGKEVDGLEREITDLVSASAGALLAIPGCGPLSAAKLIGEIGDITRFPTAAKLAMHAGVAPIPASSGAHQRCRLNRHGNRQINAALHRIAVDQGRWHPQAREYLARKQQDGKSRREAVRALKRSPHLRRLARHAQHGGNRVLGDHCRPDGCARNGVTSSRSAETVASELGHEGAFGLLENERGVPGQICRSQEASCSTCATSLISRWSRRWLNQFAARIQMLAHRLARRIPTPPRPALDVRQTR